jgi:hypothetical protein
MNRSFQYQSPTIAVDGAILGTVTKPLPADPIARQSKVLRVASIVAITKYQTMKTPFTK